MADFNIDIENVDEGITGEQFFGKDATIYLVDVSSQMFEGSEDSLFTMVLKCICASIQKKIIGKSQDVYAVLLFNCDKTKNNLNFENVYLLQDLSRPGAERFLELEKIKDDFHTTINEYSSSKISSLNEVLWVCRNIFSTHEDKRKIITKNILLFTCNDDPYRNNEKEQKLAILAARECKESDITVEVLPLSKSFDSKKFYKDFMLEITDDLSALNYPLDYLDKLLETVWKRENRTRAIGRIPFSFGPGINVGVKVFSVISNLVEYGTNLYRVTNEEVETREKECLEDGTLLLPSDLVKYQTVAGKNIKFTFDETKYMFKLYETGIELLGFKPLSAFKPELYIREAHFIYPDEFQISGSLSFFTCLWNRCIEREICPIARVTLTERTAPYVAFLIPQKEERDEDGRQEKAPGFIVNYLPFTDDYRIFDKEDEGRAAHLQIDVAKKIVKKMTFKYEPSNFDDPALQTHWRNVEALALNRSELNPVQDTTVPDYENIQNRAGDLIEEFKSYVFTNSDENGAAESFKKKPHSGHEPLAKKSKISSTETPQMTVVAAASRKLIHTLNMNTLKHWLLDNGARGLGNKSKNELVQDVYNKLNCVDMED